jgi:hypothetical protein
VIHLRRPWKPHDAFEYAPLEWVDGHNNRCLLESIRNIRPAETESNYHAALEAKALAA